MQHNGKAVKKNISVQKHLNASARAKLDYRFVAVIHRKRVDTLQFQQYQSIYKSSVQ